MMETGSGRSRISVEWRWIGGDLLVSVTGGEAPHIGAAALAFLENGVPSVLPLQVPGHREGELACFCAETLCQAAECTVLVLCGIHIDKASREEIQQLCANAELLARRLAERLRSEGG